MWKDPDCIWNLAILMSCNIQYWLKFHNLINEAAAIKKVNVSWFDHDILLFLFKVCRYCAHVYLPQLNVNSNSIRTASVRPLVLLQAMKDPCHHCIAKITTWTLCFLSFWKVTGTMGTYIYYIFVCRFGQNIMILSQNQIFFFCVCVCIVSF